MNMKDFFRFAFSFLYTRNWHTGRKEISQSRVAALVCGLVFVVVSLVIINIMQAPVEVSAVARPK